MFEQVFSRIHFWTSWNFFCRSVTEDPLIQNFHHLNDDPTFDSPDSSARKTTKEQNNKNGPYSIKYQVQFSDMVIKGEVKCIKLDNQDVGIVSSHG